MKTETILIHGNMISENDENGRNYGAVAMPIYLSSTFANADTNGYSYSRCSNPTRKYLEDTIAALEHGKYAFAFSSGLAAEDAVFSTAKRIVCGKQSYGGTKRLLKMYGEKVRFIDMNDLDEIERAAQPETLFFAENPTNPMMEVYDIPKIAKIAHKNNAKLAVDNTFLTPILQNPLDLGADIVVHSATKYLCGHHDAIAGCAVTNDDEIANKIYHALYTKGNGLSPFDSYMVKRGMETLSLRMAKHEENAHKLFEYLKKSGMTDKIYYTGDKENPGYELMKKQARGFGAVITFETSEPMKVVKRLKIIKFAESLGGNASLITHPYSQTHASLSESEKREANITEDLLRLSVGTENAEDIIADLDQAFRH